MVSPDALAKVKPMLQPSDFHEPAHQTLYKHALHLDSLDEPVDFVTMRSLLNNTSLLDEIGGVKYLIRLAESWLNPAHVDAYAREVKALSIRREKITLAREIEVGAIEGVDEAALAQKIERLTSLRVEQAAEPPSLCDVVTHMEPLATGILTGLVDLDGILHGLRAPNLNILAARPSVGKTALALQIADQAAEQVPGVFFSMEMSAQELGVRVIARRAGVDSMIFIGDEWSDAAETARSKAMAEVAGNQLVIDDTAGMGILDIEARVTELHRRSPLGLVTIDYLGLFERPGENANAELGQICRRIKQHICKKLNLPVLLLCQLNRESERLNRDPCLADLRDCGEIEQHADVVILLHDPWMAAKTDAQRERVESVGVAVGEVKVMVEKHRNGPTGVTQLYFERAQSRFKSLLRRSGGEGEAMMAAERRQWT